MALVIEQKWGRRQSKYTAELRYLVTVSIGDATEYTTGQVYDLVESTSGTSYFGLPRDDIDVDEGPGGRHWMASVRYTSSEARTAGSVGKPIDFTTIRPQIGGGTQRITNSKQTVSRYPSNAPSFGGLINVADDRVEGTDIYAPSFAFTIEHMYAIAAINSTFMRRITEFSPSVNQHAITFVDSFGLQLPFNAGEVLFIGMTGNSRDDGVFAATLSFLAMPNESGVMIGGLGPITKVGWDYVWTRNNPSISEGGLVRQPTAAYVERVYNVRDHSLLGVPIL